MKYKNIVFDLDGTLSNSEKSILYTVRKTLAEMGAPVPPRETLLRFIGPPLKDSYKKYCNFTDAEADEGLKIYQKHYALKGRDLNELYPDVKKTLAVLSATGATLYVATSKEEEAAKYVLRKLTIAQFFSDVSGANLDNSISAKDEVLFRLMEKHRLKKEETALVGDTIFDAEGARKIGADFIGVSYGFGGESELIGAGAKAVARSAPELCKIFI